MPDLIYFFIDGGYVRKKYANAMSRVFGIENSEPDIARLQTWCYGRVANAVPRRFFYYDCLDDIKKDSETEDEFKRRVGHQEAVFKSLQSLPGFHVRLGSLTGIRKKMRQKKVDVLLAVEMLDNAFRKNMDIAVLLAGDSDFTPMTEAVIRLGTWVEVWYDRSGASEELYSTADRGMPLSFNDLWWWGSDEFHARYPLPVCQMQVHIVVSGFHPKNAETGKNSNGEAVTLAERGDKAGEFFLYVDSPGGATVLTHSSGDLLKKYYAEQFGNVIWK